MRNSRIFVALSVLFIIGCASQIMKSYIGKDVREIMLDYGPPVNAFDMGDGRRAFQWVKGTSYTTPATAYTTGSVNTVGYTSWVNSNTTITGGQTVTSTCVYSLFGRWNETAKGWFIEDFKEPNIMCE